MLAFMIIIGTYTIPAYAKHVGIPSLEAAPEGWVFMVDALGPLFCKFEFEESGPISSNMSRLIKTERTT